ncbi:MAG: methyltransferase domain-containing protein [Deltaproteobacteria bacterium]|nr:methyltransferase domain-containing protein [Deltaproteobacteria bacterium]
MSRSLTVEIEKMVYGGRGMGRVNGKVVFVPFTAPGEKVQVEVVRERKDYIEAVLKNIERNSPLRVKPFCDLFGKCGGCQYQHLPYPEQLKLKEETLKDTLHRLIRKGTFEVLTVIPSPHDRRYRIRAQLKVGMSAGRAVLGFYAWRTHRVVEVQECPLLHPLVNGILEGLGNLTLPLAQRAWKVWGIDQDPQAIEHAAENARKNNLPNCQFIAASAEEGIKLVLREIDSVDVVVLDPPRSGARGTLDLLASLRPPKILYVSCEQPTLARDLTRLIALGYNVKRIQPLDMFPQTYHIEVIGELTHGGM